MEEDSLIEEMHMEGVREERKLGIWVFGDDAWTSIIKKGFYDYISTKTGYAFGGGYAEWEAMNDLVTNSLHPNLPWAFNIGHVSRMDHNIHRRGINSKQVKNDMLEADDLINKAAQSIAENSLVLSFGDHGTTLEGHHGGNGLLEISPALFAYSKSTNFTFSYLKSPPNALQNKATAEYNLHKLIYSANISHDWENRTRIQQIDIVPTMARIFNFSIPFQNLGVIAPELMAYHGPNSLKNLSFGESYFQLFFDHLLNYLQIMKYVNVYYLETGNKIQKMNEKWEDSYRELRPIFIEILAEMNYIIEIEKEYLSEKKKESFEGDYLSYIRKCVTTVTKMRSIMQSTSQEFCNLWTKPNYGMCYASVIVLAAELIILLLIILNIYLCKPTEMKFPILLSKYGILIMIINFLFHYFVEPHYLLPFSFGLCILLSIIIILWINISIPVRHYLTGKKYFQYKLLLAIIFLFICNFCVLNSKLSRKLAISSKYLAGLTLILLFIFTLRAKLYSKYAVVALFLGLFLIGIFPILNFKWKIGGLYIWANLVPQIILAVAFIWYLLKKLFAIRRTIIYIILSFTVVLHILSLNYEYHDVKDKQNIRRIQDSIYIGLYLPRIIYAIYILIFSFLLIIGLYFRNLLFLKSSRQQIQEYFILHMNLFIPLICFVEGPAQPLHHLISFLVLLLAIYAVSPNLRASPLFYNFIIYLAILEYYSSGHQLDIEKTKFDRGFIGVTPGSFNLPIVVGLLVIDTGGVFWVALCVLLIIASYKTCGKEKDHVKSNGSFTPKKNKDIEDTGCSEENESSEDSENNSEELSLFTAPTNITVITRSYPLPAINDIDLGESATQLEHNSKTIETLKFYSRHNQIIKLSSCFIYFLLFWEIFHFAGMFNIIRNFEYNFYENYSEPLMIKIWAAAFYVAMTVYYLIIHQLIK